MPNAIVAEDLRRGRCAGAVLDAARARALTARPCHGVTTLAAALRLMAKTLVIAEKPSVGQDLARVLPGPFEKHRGRVRRRRAGSRAPSTSSPGRSATSCSSPSPTSTTSKFKKWRMADLPIVPREFKLVVRDERSQKQMTVVRDLLRRDDVDEVINACDAGREGELIFAYLYEKAGAKQAGPAAVADPR